MFRRHWTESAALDDLGVQPTRIAVRDLVHQAITATTRRSGRSLATALGTVVGVGAVVTTLGVASTASHQVSAEFDALRATEVDVQDATFQDPGASPASAASVFPVRGIARLEGLAGVEHAGVVQALPAAEVAKIANLSGESLPLLAADPGALAAIRVHVRTGRVYDAFHEATRQPVALLGRVAAAQLHLTRVDDQPAIWIRGRPITVVGIIDRAVRRPSATLAVILPTTTAQVLAQATRDTSGPELIVETAPGAAQTIAAQAPLALRPEAPTALRSLAPPDPAQLRKAVGGSLDALFLLLALVSLVIGAIGIANTTLVAVLERVPEIGLRRAVGATRRQIAAQFIVETMMTGTYGGVVGASVGTILVVVIAASRQWGPTLDLRILLVAPLLGTLTGLVAGMQPAWRAAHVEPTDALRR